MHRNENEGTTATLAKLNSPVQNQASPFTKAALVASESGTLTPMKRREDLMLFQRGGQTDSQVYQPLPNPLGLPLLPVVDKSDQESGEHMGK